MTMTLSTSERSTLGEFANFLMTPHKMLCFSGPVLEKHTAALETLSDKNLLRREERPGAYSLTRAGYSAMKSAGRAG